MIWICNQFSAIPGVTGGPYAGVRVEVDDATGEVVSVLPLASHPEFEPASDAPTADDTATDAVPVIEQLEPEHVAEAE